MKPYLGHCWTTATIAAKLASSAHVVAAIQHGLQAHAFAASATLVMIEAIITIDGANALFKWWRSRAP